MPKDGTDSPIKKAPRKRAVRRVVQSSDTPVRRSRAATSIAVPAPAPSLRKAPIRMEYVPTKKPVSKKIYIYLAIVVLVLGTATWIGFSDNGQIDVNARITERNQKQANDANAAANEQNGENVPQTIVVPVQNSAPTEPNGGRRGRGVGTPNIVTEVAPVVETATSTQNEEASSTEATQVETEAEPELIEDPAPQLAP